MFGSFLIKDLYFFQNLIYHRVNTKGTVKIKKSLINKNVKPALLSKNSLNHGNLRFTVKIPNGETLNEWLAVNMYGTITQFCTEQTCKTMRAGNVEYFWVDGIKFKKRTTMPACEYISNMCDWVLSLLNSEVFFPVDHKRFQKNFKKTVKQIFKRLFRVYAHIYYNHFEDCKKINIHRHLNTSFIHFMIFVKEFDLIPKKELDPMKGTNCIKVGLAGMDAPSHVIQNIIGKPKYKKVMTSRHFDKYYIGKDVQDCRGILRLEYPMERGVITNSQDQERIWRHLYDKLGINKEEHPVLLTDAALNPKKNREKMSEIFFESFNVPGIFFSMPPILSLYSYGTITGLMLDCGEGLCQSMAIYEGFQIDNSIKRIDVGGKDITNYLCKLLRESGNVFHTSSEWEIVREIKENTKVMYVCRDLKKENYLEEKGEIDTVNYKLPDGNTIEISSERYKAPEVLFHPELIGLEYPGIDKCITNSIDSSDVDIRTQLYSSIHVSGGSTLFKDFCDRLLYDIRANAPRDKKVVLKAPIERKYTCWIGGTILASLTSFGQMCITSQEYTESGQNVIHRKSFV